MGELYAPREAESGALCVGAARFERELGSYERRTTLAKRNAELEVKGKEGSQGRKHGM